MFYKFDSSDHENEDDFVPRPIEEMTLAELLFEKADMEKRLNDAERKLPVRKRISRDEKHAIEEAALRYKKRLASVKSEIDRRQKIKLSRIEYKGEIKERTEPDMISQEAIIAALPEED